MDGKRVSWTPVGFSYTQFQKRAITSAILCGMMAMPGCGIPKLRNPFAAHDMPTTYLGETSAENSSQLSIDEFFEDPVLTGLIDEGLTGNLELKILGEDIEIANNEVLRRRGAYLPFGILGAGAGLEKPSFYTPNGAVEDQLRPLTGPGFPTPLPDYMVAAEFSWQIDIWRQLRNARDAACLRYLGTIDGRNYVVTRLVAEIAENYYKLMSLDKRIENLDRTIALQEKSLEFAKFFKEGARGTELAVQRFQAEVRKNQSEKLIIRQEIIETENRINFLVGRYPQPVERSSEFFDLNLHPLSLGVPADLLANRPDIREAERKLGATGLDVKVARANFYPKLTLTAGVGYEAFEPRFLFLSPESLIYSVAGNLAQPLINRSAVQAEYRNANAEQLQAVYKYQQTVLSAFTEVINRVSMVQNYTQSLEVKKQQLASLESSVDNAGKLFQQTRVEYIDVLFAQRDLMDARMVYIDTKQKQLAAIVNTYQALGGGLIAFNYPQMSGSPTDSNLPSPSLPADFDANAVPPMPDTNKDNPAPANDNPAAGNDNKD